MGSLFFPADSAGGCSMGTQPRTPLLGAGVYRRHDLCQRQGLAYLNVEPKRYTFLFLNGSNARTYEMCPDRSGIRKPRPGLWVIGTDGGYLDTPVKVGPPSGNNNKSGHDVRRALSW